MTNTNHTLSCMENTATSPCPEKRIMLKREISYPLGSIFELLYLYLKLCMTGSPFSSEKSSSQDSLSVRYESPMFEGDDMFVFFPHPLSKNTTDATSDCGQSFYRFNKNNLIPFKETIHSFQYRHVQFPRINLIGSSNRLKASNITIDIL